MVLLIVTNSISIIASLSLFATLLYYIIGIAAACGLRIKKPALSRPYRAPLLWLGAPVSVMIYLFLMTQLEPVAMIAGVLWCLLGLLLYFLCQRTKSKPKQSVLEAPSLQPPSPEEKRRMDREFHLWCAVVAAAAALVLLLHLFLLF